jgi:hypothetical protein
MSQSNPEISTAFSLSSATKYVLANRDVRLDLEVTSVQDRGGNYIKLKGLPENHIRLIEAHLVLVGVQGAFRKHSEKFGQEVIAVPVIGDSFAKIQKVQGILREGLDLK